MVVTEKDAVQSPRVDEMCTLSTAVRRRKVDGVIPHHVHKVR